MTPVDAARFAERDLSRLVDSIVRMGGCPVREIYQARDALRALLAEMGES